MADRIDNAGRVIAGLLGYNPGPGIYSRLERAVEAMPENVRVQELPGLLKRYKDGVPGWELKATNLDEVIAGRDVVPREELLARVREASPVYTHGEVVLRNPEMSSAWGDLDASAPAAGSARIGQGAPSGVPKYQNYGQGGKDYTELLLTQPGAERLLAPPHAGTDPEFQVAPRVNYGSHWSEGTKDAVAHARFDTHGDALRINELQSDLGIHNRKARERAASGEPPVPAGWADTGSPRSGEELPFPLEDTWADLLIKRIALEAASKGHRAIEIASPRAIADKVGGNIENYEHFYGKVVPGALERLGRKMGGLVDDTQSPPDFGQFGYRQAQAEAKRQVALNHMRAVSDLADAANRHTSAYDIQDALDAYQAYTGSVYRLNAPGRERLAGESPGYFRQARKEQTENAERLFEELAKIRAKEMPGGDWQSYLTRARQEIAPMMPDIMRRADMDAALSHSEGSLADLHQSQKRDQIPPAGRRYTMSDEMRRRIIEQGIGASVLAPLLMQDE